MSADSRVRPELATTEEGAARIGRALWRDRQHGHFFFSARRDAERDLGLEPHALDKPAETAGARATAGAFAAFCADVTGAVEQLETELAAAAKSDPTPYPPRAFADLAHDAAKGAADTPYTPESRYRSAVRAAAWCFLLAKDAGR